MNFSYLDLIIVIVYLGGITAYGIIKGGKQKSARDYFFSNITLGVWNIVPLCV